MGVLIEAAGNRHGAELREVSRSGLAGKKALYSKVLPHKTRKNDIQKGETECAVQAWQRTGSEVGNVGGAGRAGADPGTHLLHLSWLPPGWVRASLTDHLGPALGLPPTSQALGQQVPLPRCRVLLRPELPKAVHLTALSSPVPRLGLASPKPRTPALPSLAAGPLASGRSGRAAGKVGAGDAPVKAGQVQDGERGMSRRRVQAETWGGWSQRREREEMRPSGNRQEEPTSLGEAPGETYPGQARLQAHALPGMPGWLCVPFLLPSGQL